MTDLRNELAANNDPASPPPFASSDTWIAWQYLDFRPLWSLCLYVSTNADWCNTECWA